MAIAAVGLGACDDRRPQPLTIDNALTADEIAAGRLTPEVMWKMSRAGSSSLSPDGKTLLYAQTDYNMAQNRGVTTLWVQDMASGAVTRLTDTASNNAAPEWSSDGRKIYFLSDRSGSMQVWRMNAAGGDATQITGSGGGEGVPDVEGFGVSPDEKHIWWVQAVQTARRKSSDVYEDMDKSKARIYDDLMARHWDYWDEGSYRHIFIGELGKGLVTGGTDIMPDAQWDAPLAPYFDMAEIAWNNAGTMLAYTCKPLTGTEYAVSTDSDIFVYVLESGVTQNICKPVNVNTGEPVASDKAVMAGYDKYPVWSPDDTKIAFLSQRRAGNESDKARLFLYDCRTGDMQDLTEDFDYNAMNVVWEDNDTIWFIAPIEATHQLCRISPSVGEVEVVTRGDHDINAFSMAGDRIVAEMCTISMATEFFGVDPADGTLTQLSAINKPVYDNIRMGEVQKRWVKTTDGKQMLTWVDPAARFRPGQEVPHPALLPGRPAKRRVAVLELPLELPADGRTGLRRRGAQPPRPALVRAGVARPDIGRLRRTEHPRLPLGHRRRGRASRGPTETRMGCVGASYGGYSVFFLAGCHEKRFKAFIAHCGIFNFESMYGETEELFFINNDYGGPYWDRSNQVAQRSYANSPHKFVDKWDTPILIFTGEYDFRIPYTQSLEAFTAARVRGIPARLVEFENEAHQVFRPQNSLVWNREFFGWLDKYVK